MCRLILTILVSLASTIGYAQTPKGYDDSASNLMVVLRESTGSNKQDEKLTPTGKAKARLPDGKEIEFDTG